MGWSVNEIKRVSKEAAHGRTD